jgi:ABC-2 type transport system ATP-binding protein
MTFRLIPLGVCRRARRGLARIRGRPTIPGNDNFRVGCLVIRSCARTPPLTPLVRAHMRMPLRESAPDDSMNEGVGVRSPEPERGSAPHSGLRSVPASEAVVSFQGVCRHFGRGKSRRIVLRDLDLGIAPGTAVSITGGNGAGKTTLLRLATGILAPNQGQVTIDGMRTSQHWREVHRRIGFLSAGDRGLYARLSVRGHLAFWTALAFLPRDERKQTVENALVRFGLPELAERRVDRLSLGQRQRLRLALAVVHRPRVLLLDEPRTSLDADGLDVLCSSVHDVLGRGGAVVWCSPIGEEQPLTFDRTLLLADGQLNPA